MTSVTGGIDSIEFAIEKILIKAGVWMKMEEENCGKKILGQFFFLMCMIGSWVSQTTIGEGENYVEDGIKAWMDILKWGSVSLVKDKARGPAYIQ